MNNAASSCAACGALLVPEARFCEACGTAIPDVPQLESSDNLSSKCRNCGGDNFSDGYCAACGHKQPARRDHLEVDHGWAAAVTDRGITHPINQDAFALWVDGGLAVAVVCDGVSSAASSDVASQAAVDTALNVLQLAAAKDRDSVVGALTAAAREAQEAVLAVPYEPGGNLDAPSCTFVAAVLHGAQATVAWLGDSRAYWIDRDSARSAQLSIDDSWATELIARGTNREQAEAAPGAHAITRWLGPDAPTVEPRIAERALDGPGTLLVCSDGLWNYASAPAAIEAVLARAPVPSSPIEQAQRLTTFALESGGQDNIAVVVIRYDHHEEPA